MGEQIDLFNQKKEEHINDVVNKTTKKATPIDPEYIKQFLSAAENLPYSFEGGTQDKIDLLKKYFPKRFGPDGSQDLDAKYYDPVKIGSMFTNIKSFYDNKYKL